MIICFVAFLVSFVLSVCLMPLIIKLLKKLSVGQTILGYVENHKQKDGTTTMGGVLFIIVPIVLSLVFIKFDTEWFVVLLVSAFFGLLGFMDDFLKVKFKQNLGLKPYQKIIGQLGISIIFAVFIMYSSQKGEIFLPFTTKQVGLNFWIIPLVILVLLSTTNSVNLTDGIDALAGSVTFVYLLFFVATNFVLYSSLYNSGETSKLITNLQNVNILSMIFCGSILAFLLFNTNKASIFMGDVGSLCLGGFVGASACFVGQELLIPVLGFCFVVSALSVIIQVAVFKINKKRVFKMSPFHHHLQLSGVSEPKIVVIYSAITIFAGFLTLVLYLL